MYIRELQGRVQYLRNDLPVGFAEQALQDAARYVARKTGIIRKTAYGYFPAGAVSVDLPTFMGAAAGAFDVLRVTQLMCFAGTDKTSAYLGLLTAATPTIPLASAVTPFGFYVATETVVADDGVKTYPMFAGDSIQNVNQVWIVTQAWKYSVMRDAKKGRLFGTIRAPLNSYGRMGDYVTDGKSNILLTPVPAYDTPVSMTCSIVPKKEFENIDIPVDAEDAIILCARERIFSSPNKSGGGADHAAAFKAKVAADGEISLVRAIAEGGYGETEMAAPPQFGI